MVLDAIVAIVLIGMDGGGDTVFSGQARGMDAFLARVTIAFAILFAVITLIIAKMTA